MQDKHEHIRRYRLDGVQKKTVVPVTHEPTPDLYANSAQIQSIADSITPASKVMEQYPEKEHGYTNPLHDEPTSPRATRPSSIAIQLLCIVFGVFLFSFAPIRLFELGSVITAKAQTNSERFHNLVSTVKEKDYITAQTYITLIDQDLATINHEFLKSGQKNIFINTYLPVQDHSVTVENIFSIINDSSRIARDITPIISDLSHVTANDLSDPVKRKTLESQLNALQEQLIAQRPALERLSVQIDHIDPDRLPAEMRDSFREVKNQVKYSQDFFETAISTVDLIPQILGLNYDQKYLLLLQNNTELRPTGGFIGSYGIITIRDAQVKNVFIDSIYNPDGQIQKEIIPPAPLQKITKTWAMRDANWSPDFPTSINQILQMYELEGGFTPDGVIAIDTYPILEILNLFGPIPVGDGDTVINADNFLSLTQYKTSIDIDDANNPKKFLADLGPIVLEKIMNADPDTQKKILGIIKQSLTQRHIQISLPHKKLSAALARAGVDGRVLSPTTSDYFMYINSNIGGMKTNHEIKEKVTHEIKQDKGYVYHTATIQRSHTGEDIWPSGINYAYMRFYVPDDAQLTNIAGFYTDESIQKNSETGILYLVESPIPATIHSATSAKEHDKKVFGAWAVIKPGEENTLSIGYRIPRSAPYSLYIQKQAGVVEQMTNISHYSPSGLRQDQTQLREDYLYQ